MRNQIRKLILETIGDAKEEYKLFGGKLVNGLRKDPKLNTIIKKGHDAMEFEAYLEREYDLKKLGGGHFRLVFETENLDLIIKFATNGRTTKKDGKGDLTAVDANLQEINRFNKYPDFFPKVYASSPKGIWVIMEKAKSIPSDTDEMFKIMQNTFESFQQLSEFIKILVEHYANGVLSEIITGNYFSQEELQEFNYQEFLKNIAQGFDGSNPFFHACDTYKLFRLLMDIIESNEQTKEGLKKTIETEVRFVTTTIISSFRNNVFLIANPDIPGESQAKISKMAMDLRIIDPIAKIISMRLLRDKKFIRFCNLIKDEDISTFDIAPRNVGTNEKEELIIVDGTSF